MQRILIADDDPAVCDLLGQVLEDAGYTVATAPDGRTALEHIDASLPDLLITDQIMPGLTGWSLFARVRRRAPTLPIIVISGSDMGSRRRRPSRDERAAFLRKPIDLDQLLAAVTQLLSRQEDEDGPQVGR